MGFKRIYAVMLPTKEKSNLSKSRKGLFLQSSYYTAEMSKSFGLTNQHIYFLDNEKMFEGDWQLCVDIDNPKYNEISQKANNSVDSGAYMRIVAATDNLIIKGSYEKPFTSEPIYIPQPSQQFVEKYVKEYQNKNIISEVLIDYEEGKTCVVCGAYQLKSYHACNYPKGRDICCGGSLIEKVKVDKHNIVTIKRLGKSSYSLEELKDKMRLAITSAEHIYKNSILIDDWINDNI